MNPCWFLEDTWAAFRPESCGEVKRNSLGMRALTLDQTSAFPTDGDGFQNKHRLLLEKAEKVQSGETFIASFHSVSHCDSWSCAPAVRHNENTEKNDTIHVAQQFLMFMLDCLRCCESASVHKQDSVCEQPRYC